MSLVTNGMKIYIEGTNLAYHTYDDWGLYITNNNYIGEPVQNTEFVDVKGRSGLIDLSDALTGYTTYSHREISVELGGLRDREKWDSVISDLRNKVDGKQVRITFDNDILFYWEGRCHIEGFDRLLTMGTFTFTIPQANPYKYSWQEYNEDWLWSIFDFNNGYTTMKTSHNVDGEFSLVIPTGYRPIVPIITVEAEESQLTVQKGRDGRPIKIYLGKNEVPQILVNGNTEETIVFKGKGTISINFRGGSL